MKISARWFEARNDDWEGTKAWIEMGISRNEMELVTRDRVGMKTGIEMSASLS